MSRSENTFIALISLLKTEAYDLINIFYLALYFILKLFLYVLQAFLELGELLIVSDTGAALDAFKTVWG